MCFKLFEKQENISINNLLSKKSALNIIIVIKILPIISICKQFHRIVLFIYNYITICVFTDYQMKGVKLLK